MRNLSEQENQAMKNIKTRGDIVIKQAEKGSAVVVMIKPTTMKKGIVSTQTPIFTNN